jgi:hypothetical protein
VAARRSATEIGLERVAERMLMSSGRLQAIPHHHPDRGELGIGADSIIDPRGDGPSLSGSPMSRRQSSQSSGSLPAAIASSFPLFRPSVGPGKPMRSQCLAFKPHDEARLGTQFALPCQGRSRWTAIAQWVNKELTAAVPHACQNGRKARSPAVIRTGN